MINTLDIPKTTLLCKSKLLDLSRPKVMGIVNCTPDSFYSGSRFYDPKLAIASAKKMILDGVSILDIGGQSTRPGAAEVGPDEEIKRIIPVIERISNEFPEIIISVDTFHSSVAKAAIISGAHIINDVSGGHRDKNIYSVAAHLGTPYILMHMRGTPVNMQQLTDYNDIVADLLDYFNEKISFCQKAGIKDIIIDPGFGFSKTFSQNWELLRRIKELEIIGLPILAGLSRKSMLYKSVGGTADTVLSATTAANMIALQNGVKILRVHDVKEAVDCVKIFNQINSTHSV
jgi:dihydropteroate synthase